MANKGVKLEWNIVYLCLMETKGISEIQKRAKEHKNLKDWGGDVSAAAVKAVKLIPKDLKENAWHSDELGIKGKPEPKTDIVFKSGNSNAYRVSVKMKGAVQLSSAEGPSTGEGLARAASNCPGTRGRNLTTLIEQIQSTPTKLVSQKNLPKALARKPNIVKELLDETGAIKPDKNYQKWIAMRKPQLVDDLCRYLEEDPDFKYCVIEEALTGKGIFSDNQDAVANYMLNPDQWTEMDSTYITKVMKKTKIAIRGKSRDGISSIAFRFDYKA